MDTHLKLHATQLKQLTPTETNPLYDLNVQGVKKVPNPKQNYIGLMTEG